MTHRIGDRVKETASTSGTGAFTLAGAVSGFKPFTEDVLLANGDTTLYAAVNGSQWETGLCTRTSAGVLARTAVFESSNDDALVDFTAPPTVVCTVPARHLSRGAYPNRIDVPPYLPNALNDEFDGNTLAASWSTIAPATVSGAVVGGSAVRFPLIAGSNSAANRIAAVYKAINFADESLAYYAVGSRTTLFSNYHGPLFGLHSATNNRQGCVVHIGHSSYGAGTQLWCNFVGWSTSGSESNFSYPMAFGARMYWRFQKVPGANQVYLAFSADGGHFFRYGTIDLTASIGGAPSHIFVGSHLYTEDGALRHAHGVDWLRVGSSAYLHGEDIHG